MFIRILLRRQWKNKYCHRIFKGSQGIAVSSVLQVWILLYYGWHYIYAVLKREVCWFGFSLTEKIWHIYRKRWVSFRKWLKRRFNPWYTRFQLEKTCGKRCLIVIFFFLRKLQPSSCRDDPFSFLPSRTPRIWTPPGFCRNEVRLRVLPLSLHGYKPPGQTGKRKIR